MKLRLENLGRIKKAEIDIRPLTVFIGKNGTNKTWAAYALYGLVRQLGLENDAPLYASPEVDREKLSALADELERRGAKHAKVDVEVTRSVVEKRVGRIHRISLSGERLERFVGSSRGEAAAYLELDGDDATPSSADSLRLSFVDARLEERAYVRRDGRAAGTLEIVGEPSPTAVESSLLALAVPNTGATHVLPSERNFLAGSMLGAASRIYDRLSLVHRAYIDLLTEPLNGSASGSGLVPKLQEILGGKIDDGAQSPVFIPRGSSVSIPLEVSASIVRALGGLYMFLGHHAAPGDFLIIDEPEMNAHPEAILGIAEVLAILANAGVNVVVTTHSPYFVDHLENLMDAAALPKKKQALAKERMQLKDERAFLPAEKLGVYLFEEQGEHVEVKDVLDRKLRGIDWRTFSKVSDRVQNLKVDLAELKGRKSG